MKGREESSRMEHAKKSTAVETMTANIFDVDIKKKKKKSRYLKVVLPPF